MADEGYEVYLGTNRGGFVSNVHSEYAYGDEEFWQFTVTGYALDVLANMKAAYTSSGNKKGHYYGYSAGTAQMLVALSLFEEELINYLAKVVLIAPCYIFGPEVILPMDLMSDMKTAGVYGIFDPNWDLTRICDNASE